MPNDHNDFYESVKADIIHILAGPDPELDRIEDSFMSALWHWEKFKNSVRGQSFSSRAEEIDFFKFTKPRFTGLVEYYTQRYQALLFAPAGNPAKAHYFWKMEDRRIERFFVRHREFIQYYEQGETDLDELYFLREFGDGTNLQSARVYDLDEQTSSSHDWIVSRMIALKKYRQDVKNAIYRIEHPMQVAPRPLSLNSP
jgi:hypothetical protein